VFWKPVPKQVRAELANGGLWDWSDPNFVIHDYLAHQSSKQSVEKKRADTADRVARYRDGKRNAVSNAVTNAPVTLPENREQRTDTENRVKNAHAQPQPVQGVGAFEAGSLPKDHRNHALCGAKFRLCLSYPVFGKFVGRYGGTKDEARAALQVWVDRLETEHQSIGNYLWLDDHFTALLRQAGRLKDAARPDETERQRASEASTDRHTKKLQEMGVVVHG